MTIDPSKISFASIEADEYIHDYALRDLWSPVDAACLIMGLKPPRYADNMNVIGIVRGGRVYESLKDQPSKKLALVTLKTELLELADSIGLNSAMLPVKPAEIVKWAIEKHLITKTSDLARCVLPPISQNEALSIDAPVAIIKPDGRGKHFEETREKILGAALKELILLIKPEHLPKELIHGKGIAANKLAALVSQNRDAHGFPESDKPGFSEQHFTEVIRRALSNSSSSDKSK